MDSKVIFAILSVAVLAGASAVVVTNHVGSDDSGQADDAPNADNGGTVTPVDDGNNKTTDENMFDGFIVTLDVRDSGDVTVVDDKAYVKVGTVEHVPIVSGPASQSSTVSWNMSLSTEGRSTRR